MGYLVVLPDSQEMPDSMGLKGQDAFESCGRHLDLNYCGSFNPVGYRKYMERIFTIRKFEMDHWVQEHMDFVDLFQEVFLLGNSEGGMVPAKYHHATLDAKLTGRIISTYACVFNYFSGCHAKGCGTSATKTSRPEGSERTIITSAP